MNDQSQVPQDEDNPATEDSYRQERDQLRAKARLLGIDFSPNIGNDTLREKISAHMRKLEGDEESQQPVAPQNNGLEFRDKPATKVPTLRQKLYDENMKLVRVRIQCLDPKKKDLQGEILTIANQYLGTVKKFVPYGEVTQEGYHIPYCLYKMLRDRKFLHIQTRKGKNGVPDVITKWVPEFSIEILPPLTQGQLSDLRKAQIAAGSVE